MKRPGGFTLIEVLVAVTLLAIISLLVFQAMGTSSSSKERFEKKDDLFRAAALSLDRMTRDLAMAVLFSDVEFLGVSPSGEQSTKNLFTAKNNGDQDKVTFDTVSHIRYLKDVKESDLAEVTYFLEPLESGEGEAPTTGLFVLKKREISPPGNTPEEGGTVTNLLEGVRELNFRYYDTGKREFVDEWDSTKIDNLNKLPRAVEITLVVQDPVDEETTHRFSTIQLLEMYPGPNDFR